MASLKEYMVGDMTLLEDPLSNMHKDLGFESPAFHKQSLMAPPACNLSTGRGRDRRIRNSRQSSAIQKVQTQPGLRVTRKSNQTSKPNVIKKSRNFVNVQQDIVRYRQHGTLS